MVYCSIVLATFFIVAWTFGVYIISGVGDVKDHDFEQISLFDEVSGEKQAKLWETLDQIQNRFGKD